jgi:hypothetical protein
MEMNEEFLQEIEKDMQANNGSWVSNEKVIQLIAEIRRLRRLFGRCQKTNCKNQ